MTKQMTNVENDLNVHCDAHLSSTGFLFVNRVSSFNRHPVFSLSGQIDIESREKTHGHTDT